MSAVFLKAEPHAAEEFSSRLCSHFIKVFLFRYWLKGPKAGTKEVVLDNMIGYPDNIRLSDHGTFLVGLTTPRLQRFLPPFLDLTAPYPAVKRFLVKVKPPS